MRLTLFAPVLLLSAVAACTKYRQPDIKNVTPQERNLEQPEDRREQAITGAAQRADAERAKIGKQTDSATARALRDCTPEICSAIGSGTIALEMTRDQVHVVTRSIATSWDVRGANGKGAANLVLTAPVGTIRDNTGEVAMVVLRDGRVVSFSYREPEGIRTVQRAEDATGSARARARAEALVKQGDDLLAAGREDDALARYDQADVIAPGTPSTELRIAKLLDKQERHAEALLRYLRALHEMELQSINAVGQANAELGAAIEAARARILILQQR